MRSFQHALINRRILGDIFTRHPTDCFIDILRRYASTRPVSYTHLDVYKRQAYGIGELLLRHPRRVPCLAYPLARAHDRILSPRFFCLFLLSRIVHSFVNPHSQTVSARAVMPSICPFTPLNRLPPLFPLLGSTVPHRTPHLRKGRDLFLKLSWERSLIQALKKL